MWALEHTRRLQVAAWAGLGPARDAAGIQAALAACAAARAGLDEAAIAPGAVWNPTLIDWLELRSLLVVADCVGRAALARTESAGAHLRLDSAGARAPASTVCAAGAPVGWLSRPGG